jgi:hypothetical protein
MWLSIALKDWRFRECVASRSDFEKWSDTAISAAKRRQIAAHGASRGR